MKKTLAVSLAWATIGAGAFTVDTEMPAGCAFVDSVNGDVVTLRKDLRDSHDWIYWAFRVKGAEGRTLRFRFPKGCAIGSRGAACSTDRGASWFWTDSVMPDPRQAKTGDHASDQEFTWRFAAGQGEVWFSQTIPYGEREWKDFLSRRAGVASRFETSVLCRTRKGRDVETVRFGRLDGRASHRLLLTSRHHCQEATATFVLEGLLDATLGDDRLGCWYRDNCEIRAVPFTDKDGVVDGDQGKGRRPHDHARDYGEKAIYPEVKAIMALARAWKPTLVIDLHCPWLRGDWHEKDNANEFIYQVGHRDPRCAAAQLRLGDLLQVHQETGLWDKRDVYAYGQGWNKGSNFTQGSTLVMWAADAFPGIPLCTSFEIPFANARTTTLDPAKFRAFGRDLAKALRAFVTE